MDIEHVFGAIARERAYQDEKRGTATQRSLSIAEYLLIADAELSEAKAAMHRERHRQALEELLQVIAVGVACLETHGVVERPMSPPVRPASIQFHKKER